MGASRLARAPARRRAARQSRLRDRRSWRDPRALRQAPSVRRRSAHRRELARIGGVCRRRRGGGGRHPRSEEHTSELQSLMRISYAVFCLKNKTTTSYFYRGILLQFIKLHTEVNEPAYV